MSISSTLGKELPQWRSASFCNNGNCVEVAEMTDEVLVRNNTEVNGSILSFSTTEWADFITSIKRSV